MPVTRSQFKLRKRSPPAEIVSQPSRRKSKRRGGDEPDEDFVDELEQIYIEEKPREKTLREKIGYKKPEEEEAEDSEDEEAEESEDEETEESEDEEAEESEDEEADDAEGSKEEEAEASVEVDEESVQGEDESVEERDGESLEVDENSEDESMEEDDEEPRIQEMDEDFFIGIELAIMCLEKALQDKGANPEHLGECISQLDTQFVSFLRSREIVAPHEEETCEDEVKLRLLNNYKNLLELLPQLVNEEKVDLIIRQRTAIAINNFAKEELSNRALRAAVKAYLSSEQRHCPYIEDLGSALQDDNRRVPLAVREAMKIVEEVTARGQQASDIFVSNLLSLISALTPTQVKKLKYKPGSFEAVADKLYTQLICGVSTGKGVATEFGVQPLPLNADNARRLLIRLSTKVFPIMKNPRMTADFLHRFFGRGGIFTFLALEGIFTLMTKHNLEFPQFYEKLYASLNASFFTSKYRNVYFKLMDRFLSSTHLPDYLVRAFVKKLSRMTLGAPSDAAFGLIPMILNLVIRYPSLKSLVNAEYAIENPEDPFDVNESDPLKCQAQNSCLWELKSLTSHAVPDVAEMAIKMLKQPMPTVESDITKRIDTNMEYVFRSVSKIVVPPDVALAIRPDVEFLKLGFV